MRILGIDPGSRYLGYAVINSSSTGKRVLTHGTLIEKNGEMSERLFALYSGVKKIIQEFKPVMKIPTLRQFSRALTNAMV